MFRRIEQEKEYQTKPYPKLMIGESTGQIVLFYRDECGVAIDKGIDGNEYGHYSTGWCMGYFTDYNEPVTIVNV